MRFRVISLITIVEVCTLIWPSFASTFLKFGSKSEFKLHNRFKSTSVHRGVLFSFSPAQKFGMCKDVFSAQLYTNPIGIDKFVISDSPESMIQDVKPEFPIFLRRTVETPWSDPEWTVSFNCFGKNFRKRSPTTTPFSWYHLYSAFHQKWLYSARKIVSVKEDFSLLSYITLSPDYVELQQPELETHYVNTQLKLMALRKESPKYVDQIKQRVDLFKLKKLQKFILCASILSSPVFRKERLEFSFEWMDTTSDTLENVTKDLSLTSSTHQNDKLTADCIPCKAFKDGTDLTSETETLYITPTYDNQYSVIILKEVDGRFYVHKCFKNIAILITLFEEMDYDELFSNFPRSKTSDESKQN